MSLAGIFVAVAVIAASLSAASEARAAVNKQINYQGKLTGTTNMAVADGSYNMRFRLYTTLSGGSPIWTETWCKGAACDGSGSDGRIAVTGGLFSAMLGSTTSLAGVDFNQTLYLGVEIGGSAASTTWDGEMSPRKILGAVPAAFVADTLQGFGASQFFRTDAQNSTSTTSTFLNVLQSGVGKVAEFFGQSSKSILSVLSSGNVGIGSSTPSAKLSISANIGDTNTSLFLISSTTAANATSTLFVVQSDGKVGIGTSTPGYQSALTISQGQAASGDVYGIYLKSNGTLTTNNAYGAYYSVTNGSGNNTYGVYANAASNGVGTAYGVYASGGEYGVWGDGGAAGIGVAGSGLTGVSGASNNSAGTAGSFVQSNASGWAVNSSGGKNYFGGSVGLGTTSPTARLSVAGNAIIGGNVLASYFTATTTTSSTFPYASTTAFSWTATSTGSNGLNISAGCYAIGGNCLNVGSGLTGSGFNSGMAYWTGSGSLSATSSPTVAYIIATSTTATSSLPNLRRGDVVIVHADGSQTSITATTTTDIGHGIALLTAMSQARNGDNIYLPSATFDVGCTATIDLSLGGTGSVSLHGSGKYSTIVKTCISSASSVFINVASNSDTSDLSLISTATTTWSGTEFTLMWGNITNAVSSTTLRNVYIKGRTDGIYFKGQRISGVGKTTAYISNVDCLSDWDCIFSQDQGKIYIYDSRFTTIGTTFTHGGTITDAIVNDDGGTMYLYNVDLAANSGSSENNGIVQNASGIVYMYGGTITTSGTGALDISADISGLTAVNSSVVYDPTKVFGAGFRYLDTAQLDRSLASNINQGSVLFKNSDAMTGTDMLSFDPTSGGRLTVGNSVFGGTLSVGVSTTSATHTLDIQDLNGIDIYDSVSGPSYKVLSSSGDYDSGFKLIQLGDNSSPYSAPEIKLDQQHAKITMLGGSVGIGTSTPGATLAVNGNSILGGSAVAGYFTATSTTGTSTLPNLYVSNNVDMGTVKIVHKDGTFTTYHSTSTLATAFGQTLMTAVAALVDGDSLYLSGGTFDIGNRYINLALDGTKSANMFGSGKYLTTIRSSYSSTSPSVGIVSPGIASSTVADLGIAGNAATGSYQFPYALIGRVYTNAYLKNVYTNAESDGIYINVPGSGNASSTLTADNVELYAYWDNLAMFGNAEVTVTNSKMTANGNSSLSAVSAHNVNCETDGGRLTLRDSSFVTHNSAFVGSQNPEEANIYLVANDRCTIDVYNSYLQNDNGENIYGDVGGNNHIVNVYGSDLVSTQKGYNVLTTNITLNIRNSSLRANSGDNYYMDGGNANPYPSRIYNTSMSTVSGYNVHITDAGSDIGASVDLYGGNGSGVGGSYTINDANLTAGHNKIASINEGINLGTVNQLAYYSSTTAISGSSLYYSGGKFGIGTTSPFAALSVAGNAIVGGNVLAGYFTATTTTASTFPYASTTALTASSAIFVGSSNVIKASGNSFFNGGNVGIGTTSPGATLAVNGNSILGGSAVAGYYIGTSTATSTLGGPLSIGIVKDSQSNNLVIKNWGDADATMPGAWSIGFSNNVYGAGNNDSIVLGNENNVSNFVGTVVGVGNTLTAGEDTQIFGENNTAGNADIVVGDGNNSNNVSGSGRILLGLGNVANSGTSANVLVGNGNHATADGASAFGSSLTNSLASSVDVGSSDASKFTVALDRTIMRTNVAIGTTSPYSRLSVWGIGTTTSRIFELTNSASTTLAAFQDNGTGYFLGSIGLGTTSPTARLAVAGNAIVGGNVLAGYFTATTTTASTFPYASTTAISWTATSTGNNGINLTAGCFAVNGSCVGGSTISGGINGTMAYWTGTGTLAATSSPTANYFVATSTTASIFPYASTTAISSTGSAFLNTNGAGYVGIGTTNPLATLTIGTSTNVSGVARELLRFAYTGDATYFSSIKSATGGTAGQNKLGFYITKAGIETNPLLLSDTLNTVTGTTTFVGNVGFGTSTPGSTLSVQGNSDLGNFASAGYFIATTSTASIFPYASSTALTLTGPLFAGANLSGTAGQVLQSTGTGIQWVASSTLATLSGVLSVGKGGTGTSAFSSGLVLYGGGSSIATSSGFTFNGTTLTAPAFAASSGSTASTFAMGVNISSSGANPTVYNPTNGVGVILRGNDGSGTYGQLRIVANGGAWSDSQETSYFQITNATNNNATFMGGTYGADTQLNRLQFNASSTQVTDLAFSSTAIPSAIFSVQSSTASKRIMNIIGASAQTGDYFDITANGGSNGGLFAVASNGNIGIGTTTPTQRLAVAGNAIVGGNVLASSFTATSTAATSTLAGSLIAGTYYSTSTINGGLSVNNVFNVLNTNGYTGINTRTPQHNLDIAGDLNVSAADVAQAAIITAVTGVGDVTGLNVNVTGDTADGYDAYGGYFNVSGGNRSYGIYSVATSNYFSGNVGIGTTFTPATFEVVGNSILGGNALAGYFTATSSTASVFPYASTTAISWTATSTGNNGINLTSGCFAVNGTCVGGSTLSGGINGTMAYWTGAGTLAATGTPTVSAVYASSTLKLNTFWGGATFGTSTGLAQLTVQATSSSVVPLSIYGAAGQTADLLDIYATGATGSTTNTFMFMQNSNTMSELRMTTSDRPTSRSGIYVRHDPATDAGQATFLMSSNFGGNGRIYLSGQDSAGNLQNTTLNLTHVAAIEGAPRRMLQVDGTDAFYCTVSGPCSVLGNNTSNLAIVLGNGGYIQNSSNLNDSNAGLSFRSYNSNLKAFSTTFSDFFRFEAATTSANAVGLNHTDWTQVGTKLMSLTSNGKLGIGSTSPYAMLSIAGNSNGTTDLFRIASSTGSATTTVFNIDPNGIMTLTATNATSTINGNLYVNGTLRSSYSYVGDLVFANDFRVLEAPADASPQALIFQNNHGQSILNLDENGNATLGAPSTASSVLTVGKDVCVGTTCFTKSFGDLTARVSTLASSTADSSASVQSVASSIVALNQQVSDIHIQIDALASTTAILASTTAEIASTTATALASSTSFIATIAEAVKTIIQSSSEWVVARITATVGVFADLTASRITIGSADHPTGITMYDDSTGDPYCFKIVNGAATTMVGECGSNGPSARPAAIDNTVAMTASSTSPTIAVASSTDATISAVISTTTMTTTIAGSAVTASSSSMVQSLSTSAIPTSPEAPAQTQAPTIPASEDQTSTSSTEPAQSTGTTGAPSSSQAPVTTPSASAPSSDASASSQPAASAPSAAAPAPAPAASSADSGASN